MAYDKLVGEWLANGKKPLAVVKKVEQTAIPAGLAVVEVCEQYLDHAINSACPARGQHLGRIANDGKLRKGSYIAQNSAASLNRVLNAQLASGQAEHEHAQLLGTRLGFDFVIAVVAIHHGLKAPPRNVLHELRENVLASVHRQGRLSPKSGSEAI